MTHLSDEQLVEHVEGGTSGLDDHAKTCSACRERLEALRQMMDVLHDDPVPEPSPLFWQHFSERVLLAIDESAVGELRGNASHSWAWRPRWGWVVAGVAAMLLAVLVVATVQRSPRSEIVANSVGAAATRASSDAAEDLSLGAAPPDDSWALVADLAEGLDLDAATDAGIVVRPGAIEQALLRLSEEERRELADVLQAELDRSSL